MVRIYLIHKMNRATSRSRQLTLLSPLENARLALRFPRAAWHMLRDCAAGTGATSFPRRIGLFLTNRCNFACSMCAVQDVRDEGLARGGEMPVEILESVLAECSPHQPVVDLIGGEPLLYPRLIEAVKLASARNVLAVVTTNGLTLRDQAEALVRRNFRCCKSRWTHHAHLDRIQRVIAGLGVRSWGISNYFYLNRNAHERHQAFALLHELSGSVAAHAIPEDVYLTPEQVGDLKSCLQRVQQVNRGLRLRIAYAWNIDLEAYYSKRQASRISLCDLPYTRMDIHTDGHMSVYVSGKTSRPNRAGFDRGRVARQIHDSLSEAV